MSTSQYADHFRDSKKAQDYDAQYRARTYDALVWRLEREALREWLARRVGPLHSSVALDYAAGTGRVTEFLRSIGAGSVIVADVSAEMLREGSARGVIACAVQADVTQGSPFRPDLRFDVITLFRFVLNTEPDTRRRVVEHLAALLRPGGVLVFDNHGHVPSVKSASAIRRRFTPRRPEGNVLTHAELEALVGAASLRLEHLGGFGMLGGRLTRVVGFRTAEWIDHAIRTHAPRLSRYAVNQLYVATR